MRKFLAVVKYEYKKIVLKWTFLIGTLIFPVIASMFAIVPALIFSMKGEPVRIVIIDQSGKIGPRLKENLTPEKLAAKADEAARGASIKMDEARKEKMERGTQDLGASFIFQDFAVSGKSIEAIRSELTGKVREDQLDSYLIIPPDLNAPDAVVELRSRKLDDFVTTNALTDALNQAVRSQRLADANISEARLKELSQDIKIDQKKLNEKGDEKDNTGTWIASFVIGLMIYITLAIYGQAIMGAVVEEKETRIAEILFSSARPFELMMGKLLGVGMAGLTQLAIWISSAAILGGIGAASMNMGDLVFSMPDISILKVVYFFVFFLLGFLIYSSIFALIGSMVTTVQEGGQFSFPPIMLLLTGFYFSFAVLRDPNSSLSFWVSIAPFFAPITMPVRILAETPPFWQIALSILVNGIAIAGLVWIASRVYRVGMLMYGKRATLPEVWKWIRQS